jgi:enoyl-CoA hydratase
MMAYSEIDFYTHDATAVIRFNRPEVMNCIGPVTHRELISAWSEVRSNDAIKVAVITGSGDRAFCAGADLKAASLGTLLEISKEEAEAHRIGNRDGIIGPTRWTDIYKPIIAAVNGVAYAGGLEWACFADMRIVEAHASFGVTCRRWNIGLGDGGTQRLPRIVGMGRAMELILTGKVIDAETALEYGLANEIVPSGASLDRALELADYLAGLPQPAMRTDKEAAVRGFGKPLDEGLRIEAGCFFRSIKEPETLKGLEQFINRTHPDLRKDIDSKTPGIRSY